MVVAVHIENVGGVVAVVNHRRVGQNGLGIVSSILPANLNEVVRVLAVGSGRTRKWIYQIPANPGK